MPTVLRLDGYRFFFYSNEGDPLEPPHIHIRKGERVAKIWLEPEVSVVDSWGFTSRELRAILRITKENHDHLLGSWNEYFHG